MFKNNTSGVMNFGGWALSCILIVTVGCGAPPVREPAETPSAGDDGFRCEIDSDAFRPDIETRWRD